jgi:hypothetical protein
MPTNSKTLKNQTNLSLADLPCWSFLSNHTLVMMCLVQDPGMRMRDIAYRVGITERAVQRILTELEEYNFVTRHRDGRRNSYTIHMNHPIGHPMTGKNSIADLMKLLVQPDSSTAFDKTEFPITRAANGTSFGRRRGPVARAAASSQKSNAKRYVSTKTEPKNVKKSVGRPGRLKKT